MAKPQVARVDGFDDLRGPESSTWGSAAPLVEAARTGDVLEVEARLADAPAEERSLQMATACGHIEARRALLTQRSESPATLANQPLNSMDHRVAVPSHWRYRQPSTHGLGRSRADGSGSSTASSWGEAAESSAVGGAAVAAAVATAAGGNFADFFGQVTSELRPRGDEFIQVRVQSLQGASASDGRSFFSIGSLAVHARTFLGNQAKSLQSWPAWSGSMLQRSFGSDNGVIRDELVADGDAQDQRGRGAVRPHAGAPSPWLELTARLPPAGPRMESFSHVLTAWTHVAAKTFADAAYAAGAAGIPLLQLAQALKFDQLLGVGSAALPAAFLRLKVAGLGGVIEQEIEASVGGLEKEIATHVGLFSLTSAVMFIGSIRGLNKHSTAQEGNLLGMVATALGILSVLASPGFNGAHIRFFAAFFAAAALGYSVACQVKMEDMPQLVAGFHSFVGLAAVFTGFANFFFPSPFSAIRALEIFAGTAVGSLTFTGSIVAAGKLHGIIPGSPIVLENRWLLNAAGLGLSGFLSLMFADPVVYASAAGTACLMANTAIWGALGANMVLPIGGADMPVVVSLLNACSGLATSAAGFMLSNQLLTITGALVASSGTLLSDIMCRGINRPLHKVLLGGFGSDGSTMVGAAAAAAAAATTEISIEGFAGLLHMARRVVIVPGYGMAVARCQHMLAHIVELLRKHGVVVHFAIHPVAGRLPGHMNVLLAEADVPYDIVREMSEVNKELGDYDVAIVVGANDIVNPATQMDPASPIYGMPAVEVWKAKSCVVLKRSMASGYSGVDNPLFTRENVRMLFGDARQVLDHLTVFLEETLDCFEQDDEPGALHADGTPRPGKGSSQASFHAEDFPAPSKVVGVLRERRSGEHRVSLTPSVVPKLRRMGFSILLEAGAGVAAGFPDDDYVQHGVQLGASAEEVLKQADVVLKVNEPLLDEVQVLQHTQTLAGYWHMFGADELTEAIGRSKASFVNLSLIPRISRAQKLDALTSMANIAGYRAVLDAFNRLPRFSRSSVTAGGSVPPARVFVIGAGVAGLSAITTAHFLGAKVYANDIREATREQVESMGAEFVSIEAAGIAGEGVGGYATDMGEAFQRMQREAYGRVLRTVDVVVTTAMIPHRAAPQLITKEMVDTMRSGSVIVDLAAPTGGNCALTVKDELVTSPGGVIVIGETNYPSSMPAQASELLANNFAALLELLGGGTDFGGDHWDDQVVKPATIAHQGRTLWDMPRNAPVFGPPPEEQSASTVAAPDPPVVPPGAPMSGAAAAAPSKGLAPEAPELPKSVAELIKWLEDHKHELAMGLGFSALLGLGLSTDIPAAELTQIGYFLLSLLIGHFTVAGVTPALHTPLISVTNAISGIIVVGGMLQLSGPLLSARVACALAAVFLSSVNIVGGFAVTQRMLQMFQKGAAK